MWISSKGEYGLRALFELTHQYGQRLVQTKEIAQLQSLPESYLSQVLIMLRKAGFITSRRGPRGGHSLARPPAEINVAEVINALEGTVAPMFCVDEDTVEDCLLQDQCVLQEVWEEVDQAIDEVLRKTTLEDLRQRYIHRTGRILYYI